MKKSLLLACGVFLAVLLSACGSKTDENLDNGNENLDNQEDIVKEQVVEKKTSLTEDDLVAIEDESFPVSYTYQVYQGDSDESIDSGSYIYTTSKSETLIPEYKDLSTKKVISSKIEDGFIYTVSEVTFKDGGTGLFSYVNDTDSLKYLATVVQKGGNVIMYNFYY